VGFLSKQLNSNSDLLSSNSSYFTSHMVEYMPMSALIMIGVQGGISGGRLIIKYFNLERLAYHDARFYEDLKEQYFTPTINKIEIIFL
jgi:hypothetical protein